MVFSLGIFLLVLTLAGVNPATPVWGFEPHKLINRHAIFTLPPAMLGFYKYHIHYLSEQAVAADRRRYVSFTEGPRHYIDLDYYGMEVPRNWDEMVQKYDADSIKEHGILPWHLQVVRAQLVQAFKEKDNRRILKLSSDAGHYLADAHVPLHTTSNYNGQRTNQHGIHGFWETRIPELLVHQFDLWTGKATYQHQWYHKLWQAILASHLAVDSVLAFERKLSSKLPQDKKYGYQVRLNRISRVYSDEFTTAYHQALDRQVEKRLRAAIKSVGDFWYTCWVDAGQPKLVVEGHRQPDSESDYQTTADSIWRNHNLIRE